ncbi:zeta toxin family protein [Xanthomonas sp. LMG 12461]|uniref:zeta toxin family protein n=1 Tax=Xanthomonas sp. LMG 12461 TaxID=2014543 RepID=UPI00126578B2|nr:zeta toxin family protein [Xanthomonas sp. LMG 12461]KAB7766952.1 hypothetical protein CEK68_08900 [Xanthomonas sp. LMG 12461]
MKSQDNCLDDETHKKIFRQDILTREQFLEATSQDRPKAIILAGQPGAGKGGLADMAERELDGNTVKVDPDELREFHPQVNGFRNAHPYTWSGLTHPDASQGLRQFEADAR